MTDTFDAFLTRLRANWQILSAVGALSFFGTVAGADAQYRLNDHGVRLTTVEAKAESNTLAIVDLTRQLSDLQSSANHIEGKIDELVARRK